MNTLTTRTLRRWIEVLRAAPETRLGKVLDARQRIQRGTCDRGPALDRTIERLSRLLLADPTH